MCIRDRSQHGSVLLLVALLADGQPDGSAFHAEGAADLVFQITLVGEMEQPGIIAEDDKVGQMCIRDSILPSSDSLLKCLLIFNLPFTFCKGLIDAILCFLIYKPLSPLLHGNK